MKQNRIRLLLTEDSLPVGGAETQMLQYLKYLNRDQFDVHLITLRNLGGLLEDARKRADHYTCIYRRFGLDIAAIMRLRKYLIKNSINIVHTNQWIDTLYVYLASQGLRIIKISTFHGFVRTWRQKVQIWILKRFDRVVCVSRSLRLDLYKMGIPWDKLLVVYNCHDPIRFNKINCLQDINYEGLFRMVMVGNFWWWKDQKTLIRGVRLLKDKGYKVELHFVGNKTSNIYQDCNVLVNKIGLNDLVKFVENTRVDKEYLSTFDLFVFSSFADTFGIALLEAMACGLPVLVSDIPSSMELINHGEYGLYFETGNPSSCADAIVRIMKDTDLRNSLKHKAFLRSQEFQPERIIMDLEKIYTDQLGASY
jgi:glycosyltransferase involved in cell wall biosynthesis